MPELKTINPFREHQAGHDKHSVTVGIGFLAHTLASRRPPPRASGTPARWVVECATVLSGCHAPASCGFEVQKDRIVPMRRYFAVRGCDDDCCAEAVAQFRINCRDARTDRSRPADVRRRKVSLDPTPSPCQPGPCAHPAEISAVEILKSLQPTSASFSRAMASISFAEACVLAERQRDILGQRHRTPQCAALETRRTFAASLTGVLVRAPETRPS